MPSSLPAAVPEIPVRRIDEAVAFYQRLGFTLDWGSEELGLAGISKDNCRRFLANQRHRQAYGNVAPTMTWLNLDSRDEVDALYQEWIGRAAPLSAPESKPWGLHEFAIADVDGNLLRVFYDFATAERLEANDAGA